MKLFNKIALLALTGVALAACSEDNDWTRGGDATDANKYCANVTFEVPSASVERLPEESTSTIIRVVREKDDYEEVVPIEILSNTDDVFEIGECRFLEGQDTTEVMVDFSKAEIGKNYSLKMAITDPEHVSPYVIDNTMTLTAVRASWEPLPGTGYMDVKLLSAYTPDIKIEVRSDDPTCFRIVDPFAPMMIRVGADQYARNDRINGYTGASEYLKFRVLKPGTEHFGVKVSQSNLVYFEEAMIGRCDDFFGGYRIEVAFDHPCEFQTLRKEEMWEKNYVMVWKEEPKVPTTPEGEYVAGMPAKIQLAPMYYMDGLGGFNYTQDDGMVTIYFPGYEDPVKASILKDFDWNKDKPALTGTFVSEQLGTTTNNSLYAGTCTLTEGDADKDFEDEWGTAYMITSPYAEGYNLYFTVDEHGYIMVPDEVRSQPIGLKALGEDIYARINAGNSIFNLAGREVVLNITFTNEKGTKTYGTTNETIEYVTWTNVGTADWEYVFFGEEDDPYLDEGLVLQQRDYKPTHYRILDALNSVPIKIIISEDNTVTIPQQFTGAVMPPSDNIYVTDFHSFDSRGDYSMYDPETGIISALLFYNLGDGRGADPVEETITFHIGDQPIEAKAPKADISRFAAARKMSRRQGTVRAPWSSYTKTDTKKPLLPLRRN